jgi:hypothetical protein
MYIGYLLLFSQSQFCSENMNFVFAVKSYRDMFFAVDRNMWVSNWKEIDSEVACDEEKGNNWSFSWNSAVEKSVAENLIDEILDEYVIDTAPNQVCISRNFIMKTKKRIQLLHLYGPDVFEEACLDPIKTMKKDVLPRFLQSEIFRTMIHSLASCSPLPPASDLNLPPPTKHVLRSNPVEYFIDGREFSLAQLLRGEVLYTNFRIFLEKIVCSENLMCVRLIDYFEELKSARDDKEADEQAWIIYQYFVAPGSAYEVSTLYLDRQNLMQELAVPKSGMFSRVRQSAYDILKINFELFSKSANYRALGKIMRCAKINLDRLEQFESDPMDVGCLDVVQEVIKERRFPALHDLSTESTRSNSVEYDNPIPMVNRLPTIKTTSLLQFSSIGKSVRLFRSVKYNSRKNQSRDTWDSSPNSNKFEMAIDFTDKYVYDDKHSSQFK